MTRVHRFLLLAMFAIGVAASVPADAKSLVLEEFFRGKTVGKGVFLKARSPVSTDHSPSP